MPQVMRRVRGDQADAVLTGQAQRGSGGQGGFTHPALAAKEHDGCGL